MANKQAAAADASSSNTTKQEPHTAKPEPNTKQESPRVDSPRAAESAAGQCEKNPDCVRGLKHGGKGGRCSIRS